LNGPKPGDERGTRESATQSLRLFLRKARGAVLQRGTAAERVRRYCELIPKTVASPVFVKVGANDGVTGDPVSDIFLSQPHWRGVLIEPVPFCFQRLRASFHDSQRFKLEQVAIGKSEGSAIFYYVDAKAAAAIPNLPDWYDQLGSFDRDHITKHLDGALEPYIAEKLVPVRTLPQVLQKHGLGEVNFLHVDTEGYDYEVLQTLDLSRQSIHAILIEHKHLPENRRVEMLHHLRANSYLVDDCGGDYFAVKKRSELASLAWDTARPLAK
jgi:FkbM family methyltransferase